MEIFIETLTGTAFVLRVSPFETIMSVKAKIQRQEGVPLSQQHLIWQHTELEDDYCLHDYSIPEGATLKMVLAMRGGPINTRRVPMDDPALREMAEYMEANREELMEKIPGNNHQVTLLLYRDGDQLKFCRFLDMGDGTLTPLSESLSGASVCNQYEDEDDDDEFTGTKEKLDENDKTKEKMTALRNKMESLALNKKPKKKHHVVCRTSSCGRPSSRGRLRHVASPTKTSSPVPRLNSKHVPLPPVGQTMTSSALPPATGLDMAEGSTTGFGSDDCVLSTSLSAKYRRLPSVQEDQCISSSSQGDDPSPTVDVASLETLLQRTQLSGSSRHRGDQKLGGKEEVKPDIAPAPASRPRSSNLQPSDLTLEALREFTSRAPSSSKTLERLLNYEHLPRPPTSTKPDKEPRPVSKISNIERMSQSEARGLLRQASLERLGSSKLTSLVGNGAKSRGFPLVKDAAGRIQTPEGRMVSARLSRMSANHDGRKSPTTTRLPPVKQKKKFKRCFVCAKKTGLATSYQCRCGNNFCATHRYAEAHNCNYDYKTEGRKLLENSNPVVAAPKLPKI